MRRPRRDAKGQIELAPFEEPADAPSEAESLRCMYLMLKHLRAVSNEI